MGMQGLDGARKEEWQAGVRESPLKLSETKSANSNRTAVPVLAYARA
jgi:hypothetical protein